MSKKDRHPLTPEELEQRIQKATGLDDIARLRIVEPFYTPDFKRAILTPGIWLYLIDCITDNCYYVGTTWRIGNRLEEHYFSVGGSHFTTAFGVKAMRPIEVFGNSGEAREAETALALELRNEGYICQGGKYTSVRELEQFKHLAL